MRYKAHRSGEKNNVRTYYEDFSVIARRSGLTVDTSTASVTSGNSVSIASQAYSQDLDSLAYQISFNTPGKSVVTLTTTFVGSDEKDVRSYHYTVIDNSLPLQDYQ